MKSIPALHGLIMIIASLLGIVGHNNRFLGYFEISIKVSYFMTCSSHQEYKDDSIIFLLRKDLYWSFIGALSLLVGHDNSQ